MKHLLVSLRVVQRNRLNVQILPAVRLDQLQAIVNHRQRRQPQEVHLQQAHLFNGLHVVRRHNFVVLGPRHGHQFRQRPRRNHHRRRMHARPAHQPLQLLRRIDQLANHRVVVIHLLQFRNLFQSLVQRHPNRRRHQLRNPVHVSIGHIQRAPAIFD